MVKLLILSLFFILFVALTKGVALIFIPIYWFLVFKDSEKREQKAIKKLRSTLMAAENLAFHAIQLKIAALFKRRDIIGITNSRMILVTRPAFGGFTMKDYQWKDLHDAQLSENIIPNLFGSRLSFKVGGPILVIDGVDCGVASEIYKRAQYEEQAWEEKRRVRELEEARASSGGVVLNTGNNPQSDTSNDSFADLKKAKALLDQDIISDVEFQEMKAKILARSV